MPSQIPEGGIRGWIIPIGGGEEKDDNPQILQRFVELCGGADADIVVLPTASRLADTGTRYERVFAGLGAGRVESVDFATRQDCEDPDRLRRLLEATGIFLTGGSSACPPRSAALRWRGCCAPATRRACTWPAPAPAPASSAST